MYQLRQVLYFTKLISKDILEILSLNIYLKKTLFFFVCVKNVLNLHTHLNCQIETMIKKILLGAIAFSLIGLSSCTKEEDNVDIDVSKTAFLKDGVWKLYQYDWYRNILSEEPTFADDAFEPLDGCVKDNFYDFGNNGQVILDEGLTKCFLSQEQETKYYYALSQQDKFLSIWDLVPNPVETDKLDTLYILQGDMNYPDKNHFDVTYYVDIFDNEGELVRKEQHVLYYNKIKH